MSAGYDNDGTLLLDSRNLRGMTQQGIWIVMFYSYSVVIKRTPRVPKPRISRGNAYSLLTWSNEIYCTERSLVVMFEQTCSNFDRNQVYKLQVFAYEIPTQAALSPA